MVQLACVLSCSTYSIQVLFSTEVGVGTPIARISLDSVNLLARALADIRAVYDFDPAGFTPTRLLLYTFDIRASTSPMVGITT